MADLAPRTDPKRREQILRAAERLLQHYGFSKTTVADIAREAGVGVGTVYLEFQSKNAIVAELSGYRYQCVLKAMRRAMRARSEPAEQLKAMFEARVRSLARFAGQGQHGMDLMRCACPATQQAHAEFRDRERALLTEFLTEARDAGTLTADEPDRISRVLLRLFDSFTPALIAAPKAPDVRAEFDTAHRLILHGLLPRGS